jgi:hypothetical protein
MHHANTEFVHILIHDGFQGDGCGSPIVMPYICRYRYRYLPQAELNTFVYGSPLGDTSTPTWLSAFVSGNTEL